MCTIARSLFFFLNAAAHTEIYTLSLHDALPIFQSGNEGGSCYFDDALLNQVTGSVPPVISSLFPLNMIFVNPSDGLRSEEHTSELQSQFHLVCRLLLEKKNSLNAPPPHEMACCA